MEKFIDPEFMPSNPFYGSAKCFESFTSASTVVNSTQQIRNALIDNIILG
jgi:hypothetical protein